MGMGIIRIAPQRRPVQVDVLTQLANTEAARQRQAEIERIASEESLRQAASMRPKDPLTELLERVCALEAQNTALVARIERLEGGRS